MTIDVQRARSVTPGCEHVTHFNNAGASLMPQPVLDAVFDHLRREATIGGYEAAAEAEDAIEAVYRSVAALLGAEPHEVALVENATRAWDMGFYGIVFEPGDRVVTGRSEYASNVIAMLQVARRTGVEIVVIDDDAHGQISLEQLAATLDERVKLVALTHVPTSGGLVNPAAEVGRLARQAGAIYLLDACQSAGQRPLDVNELGCDLLAVTGRKFLRGPRGTGFLYCRSTLLERLEPPFLDLHAATWTDPDRYEIRADARRFETWERNVSAVLGLGAAVDHALGWGLDAIGERTTAVAADLRARLTDLEGVEVHDRGLDRCAIVTFTVDGVEAGSVQDQLASQGINTSVSRVEYAQLDLPARGLPDVVRASPHYFTTEEEVQRLVGAVASIARR